MSLDRSGVTGPAPRKPASVPPGRRNRLSVRGIVAGTLLVSLLGFYAGPGQARRTTHTAGLPVGGSVFSLPRAVAEPADTSTVLAADKGKLRITINGQLVGVEEFEISPTGEAWVARGSMNAHISGGAEIKASGQLKLSPDGAPIHYEWSAQAQKKATGSVDFAGGTAKCSADLGASSPMRKDFSFGSPRIAVLDNNLYYQYGVLARLYDWKAGGKQSFPVLIPQDMVPGTIDVESFGPQQTQKAAHDALRVSTPDLEILVYLDANHRMTRLEVPSSNVTIERE